MNVVSSWSGGKDSCFALMKAIELGNKPVAIFNVLNENGKISRSHGIPIKILNQQAEKLQLPIITCAASWSEYESNYIKSLKSIKNRFNAEMVVFGDIDIESHKEWEEKVCNASNLKAFLPLWKKNRKQLVLNMINQGIKTIITSCNDVLGKNYLGKEITPDLLNDLEKLGVDCCGENGEYHTLVVDCPLFSSPLNLPNYTKVSHNNYHFIQWN